MDWPTMRDTIRTLTAKMTGVPPQLVVWRGSMEAGSRIVATRITLAATGTQGLGWDETRREEQEGEDENGNPNPDLVFVCGPRQFVLKMLIESQDQAPGRTARELSDKALTRIWRDDIIERFSAVGLATADAVGGIVLDDIEIDGKMGSVANIDFLMNAAEYDVDDTDGAGDYIGEVEIDGTVDDAGTPRIIHLDVK